MHNEVYSMSKSIIAKIRQSSISLMSVILVAKLIGMMRDIILAHYFGTTNISDAYLIASSVPTSLFYFIGHSLSTAYIPMYNRVKEKEGEKKAKDFTNNLLTISILISTVIVILLLLFPTVVVKVFAAGFDRETALIASRLIRISAPSIYLMCMVNICGGYLQANKSFLAPAAISLPRNAAIMVSVILAASLGTDLLGWGLLASYGLEFLFLVPFLNRRGYRYKPVLKIEDAYIRQTLYVVAPIFLGVCVGQVNKIIDRSMASTVVEGGISALSYASIINYAVEGVVVTGLITVLFASCSEMVARQEHQQVKEKLLDTVNSMIILIVPACVGAIILAEPIVEIVLCRGEFDRNSLKMTVGALRCYTLGLLFLAIKDTLIKVFYAYKETKIATKASVTSIVVNIVLNLILGKWIGINGLALATSISAGVNCIILFIQLRRKIGDFGTKRIAVVLAKSAVGSAIMGTLTGRLFTYLDGAMGGIQALLLTVAVSCVAYFALEVVLQNEIIIKVFAKKQDGE